MFEGAEEVCFLLRETKWLASFFVICCFFVKIYTSFVAVIASFFVEDLFPPENKNIISYNLYVFILLYS